MIKELDRVVLKVDLPDHELKAGDVGVVVDVHDSEKYGRGYALEFMTLDGETIAVVAVDADQVRPIGKREIASARAV